MFSRELLEALLWIKWLLEEVSTIKKSADTVKLSVWRNLGRITNCSWRLCEKILKLHKNVGTEMFHQSTRKFTVANACYHSLLGSQPIMSNRLQQLCGIQGLHEKSCIQSIINFCARRKIKWCRMTLASLRSQNSRSLAQIGLLTSLESVTED